MAFSVFSNNLLFYSLLSQKVSISLNSRLNTNCLKLGWLALFPLLVLIDKNTNNPYYSCFSNSYRLKTHSMFPSVSRISLKVCLGSKYVSGKRCSSARSQPSLLRSQYTLCPITRVFSYLPTTQRLGFKHIGRGTVACATIRLIVSDTSTTHRQRDSCLCNHQTYSYRYFYQGLPHSPHSGSIVPGSF